MGFNLGNFLRGAVAQVNPWDGGQNYASVQRQAQQRPAPQRPAPKPSPKINLAAFAQVLRQPTNLTYRQPVPQFRMPNIQQSQLQDTISNMAKIGKYAPKTTTPNPTMGNPVFGTLGAIAQPLVNFEKKNPNLQTPLNSKSSSADVRAWLLNDKNPMAQVAGNSFGGTSKFAGSIGTFIKANTDKGVVKGMAQVFGKGTKATPSVITALKNTTNPNEIKSILQQSGHLPADVPKPIANPSAIPIKPGAVPKGGGVTWDTFNQALNDKQAIVNNPGSKQITTAQFNQARSAVPTLQKLAADYKSGKINGAQFNTTFHDVTQNAYKPEVPPTVSAPKPNIPKPPILGTPLAKKPVPTIKVEAPKLPTRGLTAGIKGSPNFSPELQKAVKGIYVPATDKAALASHEDFIKQPLDVRNSQAIQHLSDPKASIGKQEVVNYGKTIQHLDEAGKTKEANAIHDLLAAKLTQGGQASQAAHLLYGRTPEGLKNLAFRDLRNAKVELTPAIKTEIQGHIDALRGMKAGPAKDFATAVLQKAIAKHLPQSSISNAVSVWKAGLLSGTKTQGGNFVSNATTGILKKISDVPATAVDKLMSIGTGVRTKSITSKGNISGATQGLGTAKTTLKTGIDMRNVGDKFEQHGEINLSNKWMQKLIGSPANLVFRGMSAADQPFYYSALKNSLYDQAKADGINLGLKGKALTEHMAKLAQNPTEKMVGIAGKEADKAVLSFDTVASKFIQGGKNMIDQTALPEAGKKIAHAVVDVLAPFTKVPTAFLSRTIDFTPFGTGREVFEQIAAKKFNQRQLSQAIGEGATGTGIIAMGIALANNDMLSGNFPSSDPKEQARWKAEGITPNSVKIGDKWVSLNYLGQLGLLFNAGKQMADAKDGGGVGAAVAGLGQGLMGQSFLQGFSGFSDAIKDPARNGKSFINSQTASIVPNIVNDIANATDGMQRQANSVGESVMAKIPGLRQGLTPKFDSFGNDLKQASGSGVQTAINPLKPSNSVDSPMLSELNRLGKTGKDNVVFPIATKTLGAGPTLIKLTVAQQSERQKQVGAALTPLWNQIMNDPQYKALDDAHKKDALQRALTDVNSAVDRTMTAKIDPSKLTKPATGGTLTMLNGKATAQGYLNKALGAGTDPASKYQAHLATFNEAKKSGTLTAAKLFSTQQSLAKEAITSKYSQAVQDFYGLSNTQKQAFFKQDPTVAQKLYDQAKQLDRELGAKGATLKFTKTGGIKVAKIKVAKVKKVKPRTIRFAKLSKPPTLKIAAAKKTKKFKLASSGKRGKAILLKA